MINRVSVKVLLPGKNLTDLKKIIGFCVGFGPFCCVKLWFGLVILNVIEKFLFLSLTVPVARFHVACSSCMSCVSCICTMSSRSKGG